MRLQLSIARGVLAFAFFSAVLTSSQAWADTFTVSIVQDGSAVVVSGSGALSVSGSVLGHSHYVGVRPDPAFLVTGNGQTSLYTGVTGPSEFGVAGPIEQFTSSTGGQVGIDLLQNNFVVPFGYIAGTDLTSSGTWDYATLHDLGLTPGNYSYALGSGDSFVINIGSPASISPEPSSFIFLGTGLLNIAGLARKRGA